MASNELNPINILDSSNAIGTGSGGSLTVYGGASISRDFFVGGNLNVSGTTSSFSDNILVLNKNPESSKDTGLLLQRYTNDISNNKNYSGIIYSETLDEFIFGYASADSIGLTFGNYIPIKAQKIVIMSSDESIGLGSGGSVNILGGASIEKTLYVNSLSTSTINTIGSIITTGGNVGIGTINPSKKLEVVGDTNFIGEIYKNGSIYNPSSQWTSFDSDIFYTTGKVITSNMTSTNISATNLRLTNDLYVGGTLYTVNITTTNVQDLNISTGNINVSNLSSLTNVTATSISTGTLNATTSITTSNIVATLITTGTLNATSINATSINAIGNSNTIGNIFTTNGNVGIGTTSPSSTLHVNGQIFATGDISGLSDERAKKDILTIENALEKVESMRGVYYTMKNSEKRSVGLIAQEVQKILPEVISETEEYLGISYGNIVGLLIEAIKQLKKDNYTLHNELNVLKKDNCILQNELQLLNKILQTKFPENF
jgi:hypothetical protein